MYQAIQPPRGVVKAARSARFNIKSIPVTIRGLVGVVAVAVAFEAGAVPMMSDTTGLVFSSGSVSLFGSGGSASFGGSGLLLGNESTGVGYSASASTGAASSTVRGNLRSSYESEVPLASAGSYGFALDWIGGSSSFRSDLGANIRIRGELFGIINNFTIFERDYGLNILENFISETPKTQTGSDDFAPASVSVDLPTGGVGISGTAGVDLDIIQDATFEISSVGGKVVATHGATSTIRELDFLLDMTGAEIINGLDLGLEGVWDIVFESIALSATLNSDFLFAPNPFIGGGIGVFCGDPFDPNDNFLCAQEGGVKTNSPLSLNLFSTPTLDMGGDVIASRMGFSVLVTTAAAAVSEPGVLSMLSLGIVLLGLSSRRRRS